MTAPIPADRLAALRRIATGEDWSPPQPEDVAALLGEIDRLTAENSLFHAIYDRDHPIPSACPQRVPHGPHRWMPPRTAIACAGWPPATTPRDEPQGSAEPSAAASAMDFPSEAAPEPQRPAEDFKTYRCPTPCDDDCEVRCHEGHQVDYKQRHNVAECQARCAAAEAYRRFAPKDERAEPIDLCGELDDLSPEALAELKRISGLPAPTDERLYADGPPCRHDATWLVATDTGLQCMVCGPDEGDEPITPEDEGIATGDVEAQIAADNESERQ